MVIHARVMCMELHAVVDEAAIARRFADEIRAEMARKRVSNSEFALALGITPHTAGRRLNGEQPSFSAIELAKAALLLEISLVELVRRATADLSEAVAS